MKDDYFEQQLSLRITANL